jgi:hypothetical protein
MHNLPSLRFGIICWSGIVVKVDQSPPHPGDPQARRHAWIPQPTQQHRADGREQIFYIVRVGALRAVVGVCVGIGRCLFRGCVELGQDDAGAGPEVGTDREGVEGVEDQATGDSKVDAAVALGDGEEKCGVGVGHYYGVALSVVELLARHDHFSRRM